MTKRLSIALGSLMLALALAAALAAPAEAHRLDKARAQAFNERVTRMVCRSQPDCIESRSRDCRRLSAHVVTCLSIFIFEDEFGRGRCQSRNRLSIRDASPRIHFDPGTVRCRR
jgi:hypothetical protein